MERKRIFYLWTCCSVWFFFVLIWGQTFLSSVDRNKLHSRGISHTIHTTDQQGYTRRDMLNYITDQGGYERLDKYDTRKVKLDDCITDQEGMKDSIHWRAKLQTTNHGQSKLKSRDTIIKTVPFNIIPCNTHISNNFRAILRELHIIKRKSATPKIHSCVRPWLKSPTEGRRGNKGRSQ